MTNTYSVPVNVTITLEKKDQEQHVREIIRSICFFNDDFIDDDGVFKFDNKPHLVFTFWIKRNVEAEGVADARKKAEDKVREMFGNMVEKVHATENDFEIDLITDEDESNETHEVVLTEFFEKEFEVVADDPNEALDMAEAGYRNKSSITKVNREEHLKKVTASVVNEGTTIEYQIV